MSKTTHMRECARGGCNARYDDWDWKALWPKRFCSLNCYLGTKAPGEPKRQQMARPAGAKKKRKAISPASPQQRAKRNAGVSIASGASEGLDPAHLCPRDLGGCDDPLCVVPLTRYEHTMFDLGKLDLLPYLVPGHVDEIAHALQHYRGDLPALLERLTGCKWIPVDRRESEAA